MTGTTFLYALMAGIIPSLLWLFFWTREDEHQPEPRFLLASCFFAGMAIVFAAIPAEKFAAAFVTDQSTLYVIWAAIEESLKFIAVAIVALDTKWNDEPIDAMIYIIAVALGFAALENTLFIIGALDNNGLFDSIETGNMRFFGATLVHVVSSAAIGFGIGLAFYRGYIAKFFGLMAGLAVAIGVHAAFNIAVAGSGVSDTMKAFFWIWGAVVVMIVLFEEVKAVRPRGAKVIHTSPITS